MMFYEPRVIMSVNPDYMKIYIYNSSEVLWISLCEANHHSKWKFVFVNFINSCWKTKLVHRLLVIRIYSKKIFSLDKSIFEEL